MASGATLKLGISGVKPGHLPWQPFHGGHAPRLSPPCSASNPSKPGSHVAALLGADRRRGAIRPQLPASFHLFAAEVEENGKSNRVLDAEVAWALAKTIATDGIPSSNDLPTARDTGGSPAAERPSSADRRKELLSKASLSAKMTAAKEKEAQAEAERERLEFKASVKDRLYALRATPDNMLPAEPEDWLLRAVRTSDLADSLRPLAMYELARILDRTATQNQGLLMGQQRGTGSYDLRSILTTEDRSFLLECPTAALELALLLEGSLKQPNLADLIFQDLETDALQQPPQKYHPYRYILVDIAEWRKRRGKVEKWQQLMKMARLDIPGEERDPRTVARHYAWRFPADPDIPHDAFRVDLGRHSGDVPVRPFPRPDPFAAPKAVAVEETVGNDSLESASQLLKCFWYNAQADDESDASSDRSELEAASERGMAEQLALERMAHHERDVIERKLHLNPSFVPLGALPRQRHARETVDRFVEAAREAKRTVKARRFNIRIVGRDVPSSADDESAEHSRSVAHVDSDGIEEDDLSSSATESRG
eukprot:TRINITY_DN10883_c0_g2_i12.p1 TRINITY_DN10883_c0_g2~~TRINITY_DN10883_c0_g2_i12.p1  ORF type:complete len:540 (-),score=80.53 TRINITY_DN10883_c0_g2_i12:425-2044(-)